MSSNKKLLRLKEWALKFISLLEINKEARINHRSATKPKSIAKENTKNIKQIGIAYLSNYIQDEQQRNTLSTISVQSSAIVLIKLTPSSRAWGGGGGGGVLEDEESQTKYSCVPKYEHVLHYHILQTILKF